MYSGGILGIKKVKILFVTNPCSSLSRFKRKCTIASSGILLLRSYSLLSYESCSERLLFLYNKSSECFSSCFMGYIEGICVWYYSKICRFLSTSS